MGVIGPLYTGPNKPKGKAEPRKLHCFLNYERYRNLIEFIRLKEEATSEGWQADCPRSRKLLKEVRFDVGNKLLKGRGFDLQKLRRFRDSKTDKEKFSKGKEPSSKFKAVPPPSERGGEDDSSSAARKGRTRDDGLNMELLAMLPCDDESDGAKGSMEEHDGGALSLIPQGPPLG